MARMASTDSSPTPPEKTQPVASIAPPAAAEEEPPGPARRPLWRRTRWLLLLFLLAVLIAGAAGYFAGLRQREQARQQQKFQAAQEQFELGLQDLEAGRYDIAQQRFEYVIRLDPSYPGAAERLAEALVVLNAPTSTPVPLATPTPNLAPVKEIFEQAQEALDAGDWTAAIEALLALRAKDPAYRAVDVDGMMYVALRNRGVDRIAKEGLLEEGIYDLSLAEQFGPLDRDAQNWRSWAELYLLANSYIGVNWAQAAYYFSQVYLVAPYLKNDAYLKYATAAQRYGDQLIAAKDPCAAQEQYAASLLAWENQDLIPTATKAAKSCMTATARPPAPPPPPAETPTPAVETPTPSPTPGDGGGGG